MRIASRGRLRWAAAIAVATVLPAEMSRAADHVGGPMIVVNDNGAWSWFEDERAVIDPVANKLVVGTISNAGGFGGAARSGDVEIASVDLTTHAKAQFTLRDNFEADDHNSPALYIRPDGRYLAMYSTHGTDPTTRYRLSTAAGDVAAWSAEQNFTNTDGATYSNLHYLPADNGGAGRLYNFLRTVGYDPNILVSSNQGSTWSYGGRLLAEGTSSDRPYVRYFSDGVKIQFMTTNRHPRDFNNSIYHGYVQDGKLYNSAGAVVDANLFDATAISPNGLTTVFAANTVVDGASMQKAWTVDTAIDPSGNPVGLFQARANGSNLDHRFFYSRWDTGASQWVVNPLGYAGSYLYAAEDDYTGLAAIDPSDVNTVYLSSSVHPATQSQLFGADGLRHYELFRGRTADAGATWNWTPVTFNSRVDNIRPIVPKWDASNTALLWLRGTYTTYVNYNLRTVTALNPVLTEPVAALKVDFGATGQLVQSGFAAFTRDASPAGAEQTELFASAYASGGQLGVTVGGGDVQFGDRGDDVAGPIGDLVDDFVVNTGVLTLTLSNLLAGDYQLVLYGHDRNVAQTGYRILLDGTELGRMTPTTGVAPQIGTASSRVQFHATGAGDVTFTLQSLGVANVTLNGFELYAATAYATAPAVDLNSDGVLDFADFQQYITGMHKDLTGFTATVAYQMGDINGDLKNNYADLVLFRKAYNQTNGPGAFEAALGVPEPTAAGLLSIGLLMGVAKLRPALAAERRQATRGQR